MAVADREKVYMCHQVINKHANSIFSDVVELAMYLADLVLIAFLFCIFKFAKNGSKTYAGMLYAMLCACFIISFILKSTLKLAVSCHINSTNLCGAEIERIGKMNSNQRAYKLRFWKSRRAVTICVGQHFKLDTPSYVLTVFGDIVLQNVINLILTF